MKLGWNLDWILMKPGQSLDGTWIEHENEAWIEPGKHLDEAWMEPGWIAPNGAWMKLGLKLERI